jgi:hypothetical protein
MNDEPLQDDPDLRAYQIHATRLRTEFGPIEDEDEMADFATLLFACWRRHGYPSNEESRRVAAELEAGYADDHEMQADAIRTIVPIAAAWPRYAAWLAGRRREKVQRQEREFRAAFGDEAR